MEPVLLNVSVSFDQGEFKCTHRLQVAVNPDAETVDEIAALTCLIAVEQAAQMPMTPMVLIRATCGSGRKMHPIWHLLLDLEQATNLTDAELEDWLWLAISEAAKQKQGIAADDRRAD